jgi:hypothetical protein
MKLSLRDLLLFGTKFLGALILFAAFWSFIATGYSHLLAALVGWWMPHTEIQASAEQIQIHLPPITTFVTMGAIVFNLLLLTALLVATPHLGIRRRLGLLSLGLLLQVSFHFLDIIISVRANYDAVVYHESGLAILTQLVGGVGEQASPLFIWALLIFRYWFPKPVTPAAPQSAKELHRNARCPCGSGKKYKRCCGQ